MVCCQPTICIVNKLSKLFFNIGNKLQKYSLWLQNNQDNEIIQDNDETLPILNKNDYVII